MSASAKMKESGVEWIGAIPFHWDLNRLKWSSLFQKNGIWGEEADGSEDDIPCVRVADFDRQRFLVSDNVPTIRKVSQSERNGRVLTRGDLLIEKSGGGDLQPVGFVVLYDSDTPAVCSNFVARIPPSKRADSNFFRYIHAAAYTHRLNKKAIKQTTGIQNLDSDAYFSEIVPFPPLAEQRAIAAFLDRKTAQIDALVAKKQRLIERLQEKRQSLISHAVTKGLDPHAPMKDSGIEWLKEVPAHWNLKPLGSIVNIFGGSTPSKNNENYWTGGNIPWVSPKDMKRWEIDDSEDHITKDALVESGISLIRPPAILLVVRGMILARDVPVSITTVPVTINQDMKALVARPGCSAEFLGLLLRAVREAFFALIEESGHGTRCLRTELWRKLPLPIPPIEDQKAICAFVHSEVERATGIERRLVDQITKLQEYRQTLISAAVTGKIDVMKEGD